MASSEGAKLKESNMQFVVSKQKSLTELANFYGTDKGTVGPIPAWPCYNYTDIYEAYLGKHRRSAITILEIGVGVIGDRWKSNIVRGRNPGGASLKMWYGYFPHATIYAIDVNPCPYLDNDRIKTFVADQGSVRDLQAFTEATKGVEFDAIIDDGSHRPDHQQISLSFFFKRLKPGGLYFIENLMLNGLGDGRTGIVACNTVLNTRTVLKHFREFREFPQPNALIDPTNLKEQVAHVSFHVAEPYVEYLFSRMLRRPVNTLLRNLRHPVRTMLRTLRRPVKPMVRHRPDSETMCVILKKANHSIEWLSIVVFANQVGCLSLAAA